MTNIPQNTTFSLEAIRAIANNPAHGGKLRLAAIRYLQAQKTPKKVKKES